MAKREIRQIRFEGNIAYIPLTKGFEAIIDADDAHIAGRWNWHVGQQGRWVYAKRTIQQDNVKSTLMLHRELLVAPCGLEVDHISGDGLDNRRCNLRLVTQAQNAKNARRRVDNLSGFKGVRFRSDGRGWQSRINVDGKSHHLGYFDTAEKAHAAYCAASVKMHDGFGRFS